MAGISSRVGLQPPGELVLVTYHVRGVSAPGPVLVFHCFPPPVTQDRQRKLRSSDTVDDPGLNKAIEQSSSRASLPPLDGRIFLIKAWPLVDLCLWH